MHPKIPTVAGVYAQGEIPPDCSSTILAGLQLLICFVPLKSFQTKTPHVNMNKSLQMSHITVELERTPTSGKESQFGLGNRQTDIDKGTYRDTKRCRGSRLHAGVLLCPPAGQTTPLPCPLWWGLCEKQRKGECCGPPQKEELRMRMQESQQQHIAAGGLCHR